MLSTVIRFKNGCINIAATVRETAKVLGYDEISADDIALELAAQGIEIQDSLSTKTTILRNELGMNQITNALQGNSYHLGSGWYANSAEAVREYWERTYA